MNARDNHASFYGFYRLRKHVGPIQPTKVVCDNLAHPSKAHNSDVNCYKPQRVTVASTQSTAACSALETEGCKDCGASYGHKHFCPSLNRQSAEAASSLLTPTEADRIFAHALGVQL